MIATAIFRRQKPFSHGLDLAERVIRGKRRAPHQSIAHFPQPETVRSSLPANINLLHAASIGKHAVGLTFMPNSLHSPIAFGSGLPFTAILDNCAGTRLFPVQFITEW
ncbi:hypothetical protein [Mesorhizobium sp. ES1-4]|uniref:hypothetical protein n=1 Tax=Mesorhizobium sp. ES1-4 TaxID=2876627 RepID=UPI001CCA9AC2|nr:hypothetical protein [Mesorhizobium sp. ES1-4]MBZ9799915.1 hypothetical protein [Mesorhizobium sp. ES1-4]